MTSVVAATRQQERGCGFDLIGNFLDWYILLNSYNLEFKVNQIYWNESHSVDMGARNSCSNVFE